MEMIVLTAMVGLIYLEAAAEAWRRHGNWQHLAREASLGSIYLLMAVSKAFYAVPYPAHVVYT